MTPQERQVINLLGEAFNKFETLEVLHPADLDDFVAAIHAAQNVVLAREGLRAMEALDASAEVQVVADSPVVQNSD